MELKLSRLLGALVPETKPPERRGRRFDLSSVLSTRGFVRVALRRNKLGLFEIRARLDGVSARLIIDTGAAQTILARAGAERFCSDLAETDGTAAGLTDRGQTVATGKIKKLLAGRVMIPNVTIIALDLDHINNTLEAHGEGRVDGLIGADILRRRNAIIDYADSAMYLEGRGAVKQRLKLKDRRKPKVHVVPVVASKP